MATILRVVEPRTIESSTTTTRLPATSASGLNFALTPCSRSAWSGWMNVRPDVAVLDQALGERNPACAREADRRRRARVRNGHDDVGLDGSLLREALAHAHARAVQLDAAQPRVRAREVDELEDAERAAALALDGLHRPATVLVDDHELARRQLLHELCADQVEGAALRGEDPVVLEPPERERPDAVGIAEPDELPFETSTAEKAPSIFASSPRRPRRADAGRAR